MIFLLYLWNNLRRFNSGNIPAVGRELSDNRGTQIGIVQGRREKTRLQIRIFHLVCLGNLNFILEIRHCPQSSNHHIGLHFLRKIHQQSLKSHSSHIRVIFCQFFYHTNTFIYGKQRIFLTVVQNTDDQLVKQTRCAINDVQMPEGNRVKAAGINCLSHITVLL